MSESIWIIIADSSKVKVVSFEQPIDQPLNYQPDSLYRYTHEETTRPRDTQTARYDYRVVREYYSSSDPVFGLDSNEPTTATVPMSDDPQIAGLAARLSVYLSRAKFMEKFDRLILVAPRDVLAVIKSSFTPQLQELITVELEMELSDADPATLRANLPANV